MKCRCAHSTRSVYPPCAPLEDAPTPEPPHEHLGTQPALRTLPAEPLSLLADELAAFGHGLIMVMGTTGK